MFKNNNDVKKTLLEIRKIKDFLDDNISNPNLKQKVPAELKTELEKLKLSLAFFREFNAEFFRSIGLNENDLRKNMQMHVPGRDPKADALFREADALKCELLLSRAKFIRENFKEYLEDNRPFQRSKRDEVNQETAKKKNKKKFKGMKERMKWNKM
jgi:hypothetical protein